MANRFRTILEGIVYAGMKPGTRAAQATEPEKTGLMASFGRLLTGPAPSSALYLTNQTLWQRSRRMLFLLVPIVVLCGAAVLVINRGSHPGAERPLTSAELQAKILPNFNPNIKLAPTSDLKVLEVRFDAGEGVMTGNLQNKSNHIIHQAVVVFDLADADGSQIGAVRVTETELDPGSTRPFKQAIEQKNAKFGIVREIHAQ